MRCVFFSKPNFHPSTRTPLGVLVSVDRRDSYTVSKQHNTQTRTSHESRVRPRATSKSTLTTSTDAASDSTHSIAARHDSQHQTGWKAWRGEAFFLFFFI